jgi:hypothetical protein
VRPIDRVVERLKDARVYNGYLMALCPAHDDREPSLSLKEGDDGRVLIKCHAGCTTENIVEAIGLEMHDLFDEKEGGIPYSSGNGATVQHPHDQPHKNAASSVAGGDAPLDNSATPPDRGGYPHLRLVGGQTAQDCTLGAYAEYVELPEDFLRGLGLKEIHYIDQKAVKIPYLDAAGSEEVCVRFRVSSTGKPKVKTRKGEKHRLYGLWKLEEAQEAGYVLVVEGESDTQVGWYHGEPVIGVPGATGFQSEWATELEGIEKICAIVEPDEGGESFWQRLAASDLRERLYRVELDGIKDLR